MNEEKKFVNGLFIKRRENAPDFVISNLSFKTEDFIEYLKEHTNAKGYVNIDILRSMKGSLYAKLNDWKPEQQTTTPVEKTEEKTEEIKVDNIPF